MTVVARPLDFVLPAERWAAAPPERRGIRRDEVRLMVADRNAATISQGRFLDLPDWLRPGDAVVVNTSRTIPAAVDARTAEGAGLRVHFAAPVDGGLWSVELRTNNGNGSTPGPDLDPQLVHLEGGAVIELVTHHPRSSLLWIASVSGTDDVARYLAVHGGPIRYASTGNWPLSDYRTVFATEPGSAEMPSAGRPFTTELVTRLITGGVAVLPIVLHTGLSSFEEGEIPGDERFEVPAATARIGNALRDGGGRIIAIGTTVVRALETVADTSGNLHPGKGVTNLLVTPDRPPATIDGLVTGWHEPRSSHLRLLEAVAGRELLERCYTRALDDGYRWHEFGDSLLILR
ncbi:MAG: S-adenosylmethionine:tRNA ribosyltransferase-isomerase [Acidimicrobiia bacterium]